MTHYTFTDIDPLGSLTCTVVSVVREVVTWFTNADEAANCVTTTTICTEIWKRSALIDV